MGEGQGARPRGYRAHTRDLFSKKPKDKGGNPPLTTFLRQYKIGDTVDVVCNSGQQKGMPHKFYHGRTGKVWNVSKRAIGVEINKIHREQQIVKRIHVRVEHLRPSKSRLGHLDRVKLNEEKNVVAACKIKLVEGKARIAIRLAETQVGGCRRRAAPSPRKRSEQRLVRPWSFGEPSRGRRPVTLAVEEPMAIELEPLLLRYKNTVDPLFVLSFVTQEKYK